MGGSDDSLRLFRTAPHPCGYWPEREARDLVFDQRDPRLPDFYPIALEWGFRRSGNIVYRPGCTGCHACVAVRIPVATFQPNRSQRRCQRRNVDIEARIVVPELNDERLDLYRRYLACRHRGGGMDDHGAHEFEQFLIGSWNDSRFLELRQRDSHRLLGVAVTDRVPGALSAVYTFYDPAAADRGLGTLGVLRQIEWARRDGRRHLYLGYWIDGHPKMDYKRHFQPLERFDGRGWQPWRSPTAPAHASDRVTRPD